MKNVDEILYDAIRADEELMQAIGGRVTSTCFEVSPIDGKDNTQLPNIIVTDEGFVNQTSTKDYVWESGEDRVQVGVDIAADSPQEVKKLVRMCRRAVERYINTMYQRGDDIPELEQLSADMLAWDWMKPCYYKRLTYSCITNADI